MAICWSMACCWRLSWLLFAASCWSNALIWVALASLDAIVWRIGLPCARWLSPRWSLQSVVVGDFIFCREACKPVEVPALCCRSGTRLEAALVCSLDERAEVQPSLVGIFLPVPILLVTRVDSVCQEVDNVYLQMLVCVRHLCNDCGILAAGTLLQ